MHRGLLGLSIALAAALGLPPHAVAGEDPLWAAVRPIDAHAHVGSFAGFDLSLETLLDNVERHAIRLALVSNIDGAALPGTTRDLDEVAANEAARAIVAKHPRLKAIAWARPGDEGASPANLEPFLAEHGFVGVKLHPRMNRFEADAKLVDGYLALCAKYGVPALVHCDDAAPVHRLARRHPKVPVVLYHSGFGGDHDGPIAEVKAALASKDAELYLETAQVDPPSALRMVREVGAARVLFGTDATYFGKDHYQRYTPLLELLKKELPPADFTAVMSGNAERLFRLGGGR